MSRGGFDIDDFRDSYGDSDASRPSSGSSREVSRGRGASHGGGHAKQKIEEFRVAEASSDRTRLPSREEQVKSRSIKSRRANQAGNLADRDRSDYVDRDRVYSLRPSEIHTLKEVGEFRVIRVEDLSELAYVGDDSRSTTDLRNLVQQGLVERRATSALKKHSQQIVSLTETGKNLIRRLGLAPEDQAIYSGLVKPKEAEHDAALYRLYYKAAAEIERRGGRILRVQLDYELKEKLYRKLGEAQAKGERDTQRIKESFARQMHLPVVRNKVSLPDLRIEYANQAMEIARMDLELATGHYHAGHLAEKARAGFQIYARAQDAAGLRRVRDDHEIMTSILSL
jgi:DNA-binding MarR family transcriptional regulator